jgi:hypothetical protein
MELTTQPSENALAAGLGGVSGLLGSHYANCLVPSEKLTRNNFNK